MTRSKRLRNLDLSQLSIKELKERISSSAEHERTARFNKGRRAAKKNRREAEAELAKRLSHMDEAAG